MLDIQQGDGFWRVVPDVAGALWMQILEERSFYDLESGKEEKKKKALLEIRKVRREEATLRATLEKVGLSSKTKPRRNSPLARLEDRRVGLARVFHINLDGSRNTQTAKFEEYLVLPFMVGFSEFHIAERFRNIGLHSMTGYFGCVLADDAKFLGKRLTVSTLTEKLLPIGRLAKTESRFEHLPDLMKASVAEVLNEYSEKPRLSCRIRRAYDSVREQYRIWQRED